MSCYSLQDQLKISEVGEKAFQLSEMTRNGLPIPKGFVISRAAFEQQDVSLIQKSIETHLNEISAESYMVRSSAIGEDGDDASFAGQLDSFIVSNQIEDILIHVQKCWNSYSSENVLVYQKSKGKKLAGMGVIIQELVDPDYAGVLFTESHLQENTILVEYVEGHAEKLVSGEVNPFSVCINKSTLVSDQSIPFEIQKLVAYSLALEAEFEGAVDIEWVIKNGELSIVQCRPITVKGYVPKIFWSNTNVNENYPEAITPLLYSLARDSYYHYFKNLAKLLQIPEEDIQKSEKNFVNVIGVWGAKMYYNMSSIHGIISKSPFSKLLMKSFNNFVGYQEGEKENAKPIKFKNKFRFVRQLLKLNKNLEFHVSCFESKIDQFQKQVSTSFDHASLQNAFHGFIEIRMHSWYHASLADFFAMIYHGVLGKFCDSYYGKDAERVRNELIQAIPNLISSKPVQETWLISNSIQKNKEVFQLFEQNSAEVIWQELQSNLKYKDVFTQVKTYIKNWGYRCSGELMLTDNNYIDEPEKYIQLLKGYVVQVHQNPSELIEQKHKESIQTFKQFKKKIYASKPLLLPLNWIKVKLFAYVVKQAKKGISSRERVRLKQALVYNELKIVLKRISKLYPERFQEKEDLYFMKYGEIQEMLSASEMLPELSIQDRKEQFEKKSQLIYPDDFESTLGEYPQPEDVAVDSENETGKILKGLTACGGTITGRARVLKSVLEAQKLVKGDILITRQTDPGWASVFPLISGLVVERGGMLSHGAIVSREFGIPAVVGVSKATERIVDGSMIKIKADTGEIILNDE